MLDSKLVEFYLCFICNSNFIYIIIDFNVLRRSNKLEKFSSESFKYLNQKSSLLCIIL